MHELSEKITASLILFLIFTSIIITLSDTYDFKKIITNFKNEIKFKYKIAKLQKQMDYLKNQIDSTKNNIKYMENYKDNIKHKIVNLKNKIKKYYTKEEIKNININNHKELKYQLETLKFLLNTIKNINKNIMELKNFLIQYQSLYTKIKTTYELSTKKINLNNNLLIDNTLNEIDKEIQKREIESNIKIELDRELNNMVNEKDYDINIIIDNIYN